MKPLPFRGEVVHNQHHTTMKENLFEQTFSKHLKLLRKEVYMGHDEKQFDTAEEAIAYCEENGLSCSGDFQNDAEPDLPTATYSVFVAGNDGENETTIILPNGEAARKFVAHYK